MSSLLHLRTPGIEAMQYDGTVACGQALSEWARTLTPRQLIGWGTGLASTPPDASADRAPTPLCMVYSTRILTLCPSDWVLYNGRDMFYRLTGAEVAARYTVTSP